MNFFLLIIITSTLTFLLFYALHFILYKTGFNKWLRLIIPALIAFVLIPYIFLFGTLTIVDFITFSYRRYDFDANKWQTEKHERYRMKEDILENKIPIGLDTIQVHALLGKPDYAKIDTVESSIRWNYQMGSINTSWRIYFYDLQLLIEDNEVIDIKINTHED